MTTLATNLPTGSIVSSIEIHFVECDFTSNSMHNIVELVVNIIFLATMIHLVYVALYDISLPYSFTKSISFLEGFDLTLGILKLVEVADLG
ncbi:hypothetical protein T05_10294 [Trichinella murrelli]|uniref:Transmembrane protein n=1 Tax=Trichinella murrelli TaxID=144512 RepID=A0A0V0T2Y8_9BILA|nr:hypothetical protein T05_10294 [Trichinella murrelli]